MLSRGRRTKETLKKIKKVIIIYGLFLIITAKSFSNGKTVEDICSGR